MRQVITIEMTVEVPDSMGDAVAAAAQKASMRAAFSTVLYEHLGSVLLTRGDEYASSDMAIVSRSVSVGGESARVQRVAEAFGVKPERVHVDFRVYAASHGEGGGPLWSIYVEVPNKDKRKPDHHVHAAAPTLGEAEAELMGRLKPKTEMSRAAKIREMHAAGLLSDVERDEILAKLGEG